MYSKNVEFNLPQWQNAPIKSYFKITGVFNEKRKNPQMYSFYWNDFF
jgi:hypothetical protein